MFTFTFINFNFWIFIRIVWHTQNILNIYMHNLCFGNIMHPFLQNIIKIATSVLCIMSKLGLNLSLNADKNKILVYFLYNYTIIHSYEDMILLSLTSKSWYKLRLAYHIMPVFVLMLYIMIRKYIVKIYVCLWLILRFFLADIICQFEWKKNWYKKHSKITVIPG